jgi:hypothetical protein
LVYASSQRAEADHRQHPTKRLQTVDNRHSEQMHVEFRAGGRQQIADWAENTRSTQTTSEQTMQQSSTAGCSLLQATNRQQLILCSTYRRRQIAHIVVKGDR